MKIKLFKLIFIHLFLSVIKVSAQKSDTLVCNTACNCEHDLTPIGVLSGHIHGKNEWMITGQYMNMQMAGVRQGAKKLPTGEILQEYSTEPTIMNMNMYMLMLMGGITHKITGMLMLGYDTRYMEMQMKMGNKIHTHGMNTSGISDTKVHFMISTFNSTEVHLISTVGMSLPTGSIRQLGEAQSTMYPKQVMPYSMQQGSGTYDVILGLHCIYQTSRLSSGLLFNANIRNGFNTLDYRLGNEFESCVWSGYQWTEGISSSLRVNGFFTSAIRGKNIELNNPSDITANALNYGGTCFNTFIGASYRPTKDILHPFRIRVEYGIPFYQNLNGKQMTIRNYINTDLSYYF